MLNASSNPLCSAIDMVLWKASALSAYICKKTLFTQIIILILIKLPLKSKEIWSFKFIFYYKEKKHTFQCPALTILE